MHPYFLLSCEYVLRNRLLVSSKHNFAPLFLICLHCFLQSSLHFYVCNICSQQPRINALLSSLLAPLCLLRHLNTFLFQKAMCLSGINCYSFYLHLFLRPTSCFCLLRERKFISLPTIVLSTAHNYIMFSHCWHSFCSTAAVTQKSQFALTPSSNPSSLLSAMSMIFPANDISIKQLFAHANSIFTNKHTSIRK